jgi:hypothetical protein
MYVPFSDPSWKSPQVTYTTPTPDKRAWKLRTSTKLRATWCTDSLDMVVLSSTGASRYQKCCIDGGTSPEYFGYHLVMSELFRYKCTVFREHIIPGLQPMITWQCMILDDGKFVPEIVGDKSLIYIYTYIYNTLDLVRVINCVHWSVQQLSAWTILPLEGSYQGSGGTYFCPEDKGIMSFCKCWWHPNRSHGVPKCKSSLVWFASSSAFFSNHGSCRVHKFSNI